jgi:hypothetical protein
MKTFLPCVFALLLLLPAPSPARAEDVPACACAGKAFKQRFRSADAVFTGTVQDIVFVKNSGKGGGGRWNKSLLQADPPITVTLTVDTAYKDTFGKKIFTLNTSLTKYTCSGYPFVKGKGYLVFAYKKKDAHGDTTSLYSFPAGTYEVGGLCGGTREIEKAGDELELLTPEKAPPPAEKTQDVPEEEKHE